MHLIQTPGMGAAVQELIAQKKGPQWASSFHGTSLFEQQIRKSFNNHRGHLCPSPTLLVPSGSHLLPVS